MKSLTRIRIIITVNPYHVSLHIWNYVMNLFSETKTEIERFYVYVGLPIAINARCRHNINKNKTNFKTKSYLFYRVYSLIVPLEKLFGMPGDA